MTKIRSVTKYYYYYSITDVICAQNFAPAIHQCQLCSWLTHVYTENCKLALKPVFLLVNIVYQNIGYIEPVYCNR